MYDGIKRKCVQCGEIYVDGSRICPCCKCATKREDGIEEYNQWDSAKNGTSAKSVKSAHCSIKGKTNSHIYYDRLIFVVLFIVVPVIIILIEGLF